MTVYKLLWSSKLIARSNISGCYPRPTAKQRHRCITNMRRLLPTRRTKISQSWANEASSAVVPVARRIITAVKTCIIKPVVPSQTAGTFADSSTGLPSPPPSPPILGVPFACHTWSPVEALDVLDDYAASPARLREEARVGIKSEPKSLSPLPDSEAVSPLEHGGESAASCAVTWTGTQGGIKSEPKSPRHLPQSREISPFECIDSVDPVSRPLLKAVPSSSLSNANNTDPTLLTEPSPADHRRASSAMHAQKTFAARTSHRGTPDCAGDGCADSDESTNVGSAPKVSESDSESGFGSASGTDEDVPSSMAEKSRPQRSLEFKKLYSSLIKRRRKNNSASTRYRQKKKQELSKIEKEIPKLEETNAILQSEVQSIEDEISHVKHQLLDLARAKETINVHIVT